MYFGVPSVLHQLQVDCDCGGGASELLIIPSLGLLLAVFVIIGRFVLERLREKIFEETLVALGQLRRG